MNELRNEKMKELKNEIPNTLYSILATSYQILKK